MRQMHLFIFSTVGNYVSPVYRGTGVKSLEKGIYNNTKCNARPELEIN